MGKNVGQHLTLVIDSVTPAASAGLVRLAGHRFDVTLNLFNPLSTAQCQDRTGSASITTDDLPDELANATARKGGASGQWQVEGARVDVNLNPGVFDNNLRFSLPLDGSPGSWSLSTFAGAVARGRLIPESGGGT
jgi:hypothetical protein